MTGNDSDLTVEQWLQIRKDEGQKINADDAEVFWTHALTLDPYGVSPDLPEDCHQVGREYFARSPCGVWVSFRDLPDGVHTELWERLDEKLASSDDRCWFLDDV